MKSGRVNPWTIVLAGVLTLGAALFLLWSTFDLARKMLVLAGPLAFVALFTSALIVGAWFFISQANAHKKTKTALLEAKIYEEANELERLVANKRISLEEARNRFVQHWNDHSLPSLHTLDEDQKEYLTMIHESRKAELSFFALARE